MTAVIPMDFTALMSEMKEDIGKLKRRAQPTSAADLLGPGAASLAIQVDDLNDVVLNGSYYAEPGARHTPNPLLRWTGSVIAKDNGSGMQQFWNTDDLDYVQYRMRTYIPDGAQGYEFSEWKSFATPTGFVQFEHLDPAWTDALQDTLDDIAEDLGFILPPLLVYRQNSAPTDPDGGGRALQVGDIWVETDSDDHAWTWDGTAWVDLADYVLGQIDAINPVTGGVLQTSAFPDTGIKITSTGMVAYDSGGDPSFILDASDGSIVLDGSVVAVDINGATVTGGLLQTDGAADTGIKINNAGFAAYDAGGDATFTIDAATGSVTLLGALTGGGTITGPTFRTAPSGQRIELNSSVVNTISFYSGNAHETQYGYLLADDQVVGSDNSVYAVLSSPSVVDTPSGLTQQAYLNLTAHRDASSGVANSTANLVADTFIVDSEETLVGGHLTIQGSGWITFPYAANYQAFAGYGTPQYKDFGDRVVLRGLITRNTSTAASGSVCGTLPAGFRPNEIRRFYQELTGAVAAVEVEADGEIKHYGALTTVGYLVLDGIEFYK